MSEYFVSTSGNNSNPGTLASPWLTAQKAANTVVAGDIVYFRAGSYAGFTAVNDGVSGSVITFKNYNGEAVYIDASLGVVSGTDGSNTVNASFRSYLVFDGLRITGNTEDSATYTGRAAIGIEMHTSDHITVQNCWISYALGTGVGIYESAHDVIVQNCRIFQNAKSNYARPSGFDWGAGMIAFHGCYNILFKNNLIYWNHGEGVTAGDHAHEVTFDGNVVCDNWSVNLYASDGSQNITVKNNIIYNTDSAINFTAHSSNNPDCIALTVGDSSPSFPLQLDLTGIRIYNNIVFSKGSRVIVRFFTSGSRPDSDWVIANNTFILRNGPGLKFSGAASISNFKIENNLFGSLLATANSDEAFINITPTPTSTIIGKNLYHTTGSPRWILNGVTYSDYASWAAASGDSGSLVSNPSLVDIAVSLPVLRDGDDGTDISTVKNNILSAMRLQAGSPAIDAAIDLSQYFTTDIYGNLRS